MPTLARDLMQSAVTVTPEQTCLQVLDLFVVASIRGAPVVDASGAVVGVISVTDLLRAVHQACDEDLDPGEVAGGDASLAGVMATLTAGEVATPEVIWVAPELPIAQVAHTMRTRGIHRVLVGTGGKLAGVLTAFDLLAAVE